MMFSVEGATQLNANEDEEEVHQKPKLIELSVRKSQVIPQTSVRTEKDMSVLCKESLLSSFPESSCHSNEGDGKYPRTKAINERNQTPVANNSIENSTQNNGYQCKIRGCPVMKPLEEDLFEHVRIDHADRKHRCNVCPMAFKQASDLIQHSLIHSGDKPVECNECGMKFNKNSNFKKHQLLIHNEKSLVCCRQKNCGMRVPKNELYEHIRTAHPKEKFQCDTCPMSFKEFRLLNLHIRKHDGIKPHECEICGKRFPRSSSYKNHIKLHTGERPFKCDICGKGFSRPAHMRAHMRTHTGEKPFPCNFCEKYFVSSSHRSSHEKFCSVKQQ